MRTDLTRALRKGLHQPGFYKIVYKQAGQCMREYEKRLDDLVWACRNLVRLGDHPDIIGRAQLILIELGATRPPAPKKCVHCKKVRGDHKANTFNCPVGQRTRVGHTHYDPERTFLERPTRRRQADEAQQ